MVSLFEPLKKQAKYLSRSKQKELYKAFCVAERAHQGQTRQTGEPYITHPVGVAQSLAGLKVDTDCLIGALLHDLIEDTEYLKNQISEEFGETVAEIVEGVSRLEGYNFTSTNHKQAGNFSKMLLAMAKDPRVILIKLADRIHNMKTVEVFDQYKRRRIAKETLEIYAPLAAKIGINSWRIQLEDSAFKILHPKKFEVLSMAIAQAKGKRKELIERTIVSIKQQFKRNRIKLLEITGREKRSYSLYKKMKEKKLKLTQISDMFAFRLIVNSEDECYRSLGLMHSLYCPLPGKFKDYIALPKPNGYQSIHTVLIDQNGVQAEIQIRTKKMNINAEYGIAAHWLYKTGHSVSDHGVANDWMNRLIEMHRENSNLDDFFEGVKRELKPQEVFVFTPKGDVISLMAGATALDFAYAIHSKVGNHAVSCRINLKDSDIGTVLKNGDIVTIKTSTFAQPNAEKLNYCITGKARSTIRQYLRKAQKKDIKKLGILLFRNSLQEANLGYKKIPKYALRTLLEELNLNNIKELITTIGKGERPANLIAFQLKDILRLKENKLDKYKDPAPKEDKGVIIDGTKTMALQFARCCMPVKGDLITAHLSMDKGLVIHRVNCPNVKSSKQPEKWVSAWWREDSEMLLKTKIKIISSVQEGLVAEVVGVVSQNNIDIEDVNIHREFNQLTMELDVKVKDRYQLAQIIKLLRSRTSIKKVFRHLG